MSEEWTENTDESEKSSPLSADIIKAQEEAEREAEKYAKQLEHQQENENEVVVPKLLQLPEGDIKQKTKEFKAKGQQLDLLLLKAESYSHFIVSNLRDPYRHIGGGTTEPAADIFQSPAASSQKQSKDKTSGSSSSSSTTKRQKRNHNTTAEITPSEAEANLNALTAMAKPAQRELFVQPSNLVGGKLLPYQLEGLQWLLSLWGNGLSGILADEMGLGKTIQIIALIAHLRSCDTPGPYLIVAPLATVPNWINEFKKWCPSCPVIMYHGNIAERQQLRAKYMAINNQKSLFFPVVITSFEICMSDRKYLENYTWQYVILDEGHRIKNRNCKLVLELKSIKSISRLLLTGTPIQNTLEELWSLLNFCCPMIFDDLRVFQAWFGFRNIGHDTKVEDIIGEEQQQRVVSKLHEILRPFLLRRLKKDVLLKMPPKLEIVVYCGMSKLQQEYYARVQDHTLRETLMAIGILENGSSGYSTSGKEHTSFGSNTLMQLRKVCNHPFLFGEPRDENGQYIGESNPQALVRSSGKFVLLSRMLPRLKAGNHKVLIFSQMTKLLDILEDYIRYCGYLYCRLDGSTKVHDRQIGIDKFNKDPNIFIYLLSTRAGGLGINLTAADTCILFDSDWNPHQDSQAQDRCHRIGQSKPVVVYRLLTTGSVDIQMMEKQISKKKLERLTIHGGDYRRGGQRSGSQLTLASLRQLLADDVKNLGRMSKTVTTTTSGSTEASKSSTPGKGGRKSSSSLSIDHGTAEHKEAEEEEGEEEEEEGKEEATLIKKEGTCSSKSSSGIKTQQVSASLTEEISDEELDMIMDRHRLFVQSMMEAKEAFKDAAHVETSGSNQVESSGSGNSGASSSGKSKATKSTTTTTPTSASTTRGPSPRTVMETPLHSIPTSPCSSTSSGNNSSSARSSGKSSSSAASKTKATSSSSSKSPTLSSSSAVAASPKIEVVEQQHVAGSAESLIGKAGDKPVTYDVCTSIPIEGDMYDIVVTSTDTMGGVLQGFSK